MRRQVWRARRPFGRAALVALLAAPPLLAWGAASAPPASAHATPGARPAAPSVPPVAPSQPEADPGSKTGEGPPLKGQAAKVWPSLRAAAAASAAPAAAAAGPAAAAAAAAPQARSVQPTTVNVEVPVDQGADAAVKAVVSAHGGTVTGEVPGALVQAKVPASALDDLADVPGVQEVRPPQNINIPDVSPAAGSVTGIEVGKTLASQWQAAGITGAGINVGIVDVFDGSSWSNLVASGDVPNVNLGTDTFCRSAGSACGIFDQQSIHGNAVAEVIHDMAPGARIFLAYAETTSDLRAAVDWMASKGVTIVNRSQGAPLDGPGNGTGPLADVAGYAVSKGITWFNSAGNAAGGGYWRGHFTDTDGDGNLNFNGGPNDMAISVNPCAVVLGVRWNDWGPPATRNDFDVYIDANNNGRIDPGELGWEADQRSGAPPVEMAGGLAGDCSVPGPKTVNIIIHLFKAAPQGTAGDTLEILVNGGSLAFSSNPFSATQPISDSANPGVVSVGAIDPAAGTTVAFYSSQGPTNDGRTKPDLVAPSCIATVEYGSCFNGTSAASPVAAGAAALVRQSGLTAEPATVRAFLISTAVDRASPGVDNLTGYGEVQLSSALPPSQFHQGRFNAVTPFRLVDTRAGQGQPGGRVAPGGVVKATVVGVGPIPASGVTAVVLNVTANGNGGPGYLQAYPHAWARIGGSSNLNLDRPSQTVANLVTVPVGLDGKVAVYDQPGSEVLIDVLGYYSQATTSKGGRYRALTPVRLYDSRATPSKPAAGSVTTIPVAGKGGVPANGASAVIVNLTATLNAQAGFVQALPGQSGAPGAWSNLNVDHPSQTIANLAVVPLDASGAIRLYTSVSTHLIVDVMGFVTDETAAASASGLFTPIAPTRLRDTRQGGGPIPAGGRLTVNPLANPALSGKSTSALMLNVTATQAIGPGFVQVYPTGAAVEGKSSNLNVERAGQTVPNAVAATLGNGSQFTIFTQGGGQLIADASGWYAS